MTATERGATILFADPRYRSDMTKSVQERITEQRAAANTLPTSTSSAEFTTWNHTTRSILERALGKSHHVTTAFVGLRWTPQAYALGDTQAFRRRFQATIPKAQGLLDAALVELDNAGTASEVADEVGYDDELWAHVAGQVQTEEWGKVASLTAVFTEDRVRKWAGRPVTEVGEKLMTAIFGDKGDFRLGLTESEKQGWHRFAMGISAALRNVDAHRLQQRADHRLYAMGVLGASSLLLTQMRYEHGSRFHDTSPAGPTPSSPIRKTTLRIRSRPGPGPPERSGRPGPKGRGRRRRRRLD